ncbi:MAG TPA: hypothetical protein PK908_05240 [Bacteroidales bacterium]|jgi:hypothetical protein|nr:hypothetical protein [Bacteroidales bacterium]
MIDEVISQFSSLQPEKYYDNAEIVHLTAKQIIKDFAMFGLDIQFSGNTEFAYMELMGQMVESIQGLLQHDSARLFALMYQIDLSQTAVDKCLGSSKNIAAHLADLVIRREMLKVLTVKYFKELKNKN